MKKIFTKLVSVGLCIAFSFVAFAQQNTSKNAFVSEQNEVELRIGENKWDKVWADSIISYQFSGEKSSKAVISVSGNNAAYTYYRWQNNSWVFSSNQNRTKSEYDFDPYFDVVDGSLVVRLPIIDNRMSTSLSNNSNPASKVERNQSGQLVYAEGNQTSISITYNSRGQISAVLKFFLHGSAAGNYQYQYDENGYFIGYFSNSVSETAVYDSQGKIIRKYQYFANMPELNIFSVYHYSDGSSSIVDNESNKPVTGDNQGGFGVQSPVRIDSLSNGSLVIEFPDGFTLDENNTSLTVEYSNLYDLVITKGENNSWKIEVKPKTLRSVALRADKVSTMLQIAYKVDEKVKKGTYDISVHSILFETKGGNEVPEPAITVPAVVERLGVGNEQIDTLAPAVYTVSQTIHIHVSQAERIAIYSTTGQKLYETEIQSGLNTINAAHFPQGVLFIQGSSGWTKKVIVK